MKYTPLTVPGNTQFLSLHINCIGLQFNYAIYYGENFLSRPYCL
jgi:hypothetical protein